MWEHFTALSCEHLMHRSSQNVNRSPSCNHSERRPMQNTVRGRRKGNMCEESAGDVTHVPLHTSTFSNNWGRPVKVDGVSLLTAQNMAVPPHLEGEANTAPRTQELREATAASSMRSSSPGSRVDSGAGLLEEVQETRPVEQFHCLPLLDLCLPSCLCRCKHKTTDPMSRSKVACPLRQLLTNSCVSLW